VRAVAERALTLVLMSVFAIFLAAQIVAGRLAYNDEQLEHGGAVVSLSEYLRTGHVWEAVFENWESEFLQMAAFVILTTRLVQRGSPESRRFRTIELVDADPRRFRDLPDVPWPVRRGGWILFLYERSLGIAFVLLFLISWAGHAFGGWLAFQEEEMAHGAVTPPPLQAYLASSTFWFESFQNWQSEFLAIASMVWLAVYLRQRGSPESKPVHAPHDETGR
jgi:hypothetical protein